MNKPVRVNVFGPGDTKPWASFDAPKALVAAWKRYAKDEGITPDQAFERAIIAKLRRENWCAKPAAVRAKIRGLRSQIRVLRKAISVAEFDIQHLEAA
jgi:hypothetical protein